MRAQSRGPLHQGVTCKSRGEALADPSHQENVRRGAVAAVLVAAIATAACHGEVGGAGERIEPVYDKKTGKLELLKYDSNRNGVIDTWSYMNGPRVERIEID